MYTLFVRCARVVFPLPLPPRGASPTPPALNRSGPVRKWMLRPESFDLALARDVFFAVMTAGARRERDADGGAEGDRDVAVSYTHLTLPTILLV